MGNQLHYKKYKERDQNISEMFVSILHHSISHEGSGYTFYNEKKHLLEKISVHRIQVTGSSYCRIVFRTMYTSKIRS